MKITKTAECSGEGNVGWSESLKEICICLPVCVFVCPVLSCLLLSYPIRSYRILSYLSHVSYVSYPSYPIYLILAILPILSYLSYPSRPSYPSHLFILCSL